MPFVRRAEILYEKGDIVPTVITLIEGLKKYPDHSQAFRWMIDLYCDEVESSGLEEDLIIVIDQCQDPEGVYTWIYKRLQRSGKTDFIKKLDRARRQSGGAAGRAVIPLEELTVMREETTHPTPEPPIPQILVGPEGSNDDLSPRLSLPNRHNAPAPYPPHPPLPTQAPTVTPVKKAEHFWKEDKDSMEYYAQESTWTQRVEPRTPQPHEHKSRSPLKKKPLLLYMIIILFIFISLVIIYNVWPLS